MYLSTFKKCSYDSDNKFFLVENETECFDLDGYFKDRFVEFGVADRPHSLDSIYSQTHNFLAKSLFVEFRNQSAKSLDNKANIIYSKIFNSILVFLSDNRCRLEDCLKKNHLLIVYNNHKGKISGHLDNLSNRSGGLKGVERFKKYCFREVKLIDSSEFDNYIDEFNRLTD